MTRQLSNQTQQQTPTTHPLSSGILQRKCTSCGQHSIGGECGGCQNKQSPSPMPISTSRLAQDFSRVPIRATSVPVIQTKLIVRQPDDKYEQEADRLAAKVVNQINAPKPPQSIQRQSILGKPTTADISIMRRKAGEPVDVNQAIEQSIQGSRGKGQPLADDIRGSMEQAFGAEFSGVKIHADGKSDQLNHSLSARAFTTGQDIFFKQGEYNPESQQGQELLAHELTHVVQQTGAINRKSTSEQPKTPKVNKGKRESQQTLEVSRASQIIQRREICDASGVCWSEEGSDESFYSQEPNASYSTDVGTLAEPTQVQEEDPDKPVFDAYKGKNINKIAHVSAPSREYIIAKTSGVNVRAKPDGTLPPIAKVIYDTKVQVLALDNTGAFYYIIANMGAEGWINKNYVVLDPPDFGSHLHHITESNLTTILKNEYVDKGLWTLSTGNDYTTLAAAVRVANEGLGGVSVNGEKAQKYKNENWTKRVSDPWMIDNFAIYHGSEIKKGDNIWLPSPDYVRMLQSSGQIGSRPGSINTAVDIGNGIIGFSAGIVSGVFGTVWDTLVGAWKLGEGIVTAVKKALYGSLFASIKLIYDTIMSIEEDDFRKAMENMENMVDEVITMGKEAFTNFKDQWNHADKYKMWHFRGYTIGAIALEVVLAIVTGGGTVGAKVLAKIGKYLPKLEKILNKLLEVVDDLDFRRQRGKGGGDQSQDGDRKDDRNRDQDDENMSNWENLITKLENVGLPRDYINRLQLDELQDLEKALNRWNLDASGKNQGVTHILDYAAGTGGAGKTNRLQKLDEYTGTGPFDINDPRVMLKVTNALDNLVAHAPMRQLDKKTIYFVAKGSAAPPFSNSQKGIVVIKFSGSYATFFNTDYKSFMKTE